MKENFEEVLEATAEKVEAFAAETKSGLGAAAKRLDHLEAKLGALDEEGALRRPAQPKSIGALLKESKGYQAYQEQGELPRGQSVKLLTGLSLKNTVASTLGESGSPSMGFPVQPDRYGQVVGRPLRPLRILDYLPVSPVASNALELVRNNTETDNAAVQASEGATKAESDYGFSLKTVRIATIAHFLRLSNQVLADAPVLEGFINNVLLHRVRQKLESLVINGQTGSVEGFLDVAPTIQTAGPLGMDRIGEALTAVEVADYVPDAIIVHPRPWDAMRRAKDTQGNYLIGSFQDTPQPRIWGLPVIVSRSISETRILVGAFLAQSSLLETSAFNVEASRHDGTNFTSNLTTVLAEGRYGLRINDPNAFAQIVVGGSPGG